MNCYGVIQSRSFLAVAVTTASTHFAYPRRDGTVWVDLGAGEVELTRPKKITHPGTS